MHGATPHAGPPPAAPPQPSTAVFRGDADQLVDQLIEACQAHLEAKPGPGHGRELVPYDFEGTPNPVSPAGAAPAQTAKHGCAGEGA